MVLFSSLPQYPPDPIFQIKEEFDLDPRKNKVDLGIGMYRDDLGSSYLFQSVKEAQKLLVDLPRDYLPIAGDETFLSSVYQLLFPDTSFEHAKIQTAGGTGAFFILGNLLKKVGYHQILIPKPTWSNHRNIFQNLYFSVIEYPYFNLTKFATDFENTLDFLNQCDEKSVLLLHGCCHNPSGIDFSMNQWEQVLEIAKKRSFFVIFDVAYQGLGNGFKEDAKAYHLFFNQMEEIAICYSFSKNFGLYGDRLGTLIIKSKEKNLLSNLQYYQRTSISNPPLYGCQLVQTILTNEKLKKMWREELVQIQMRLKEIRMKLQSEFEKHLGKKDWLANLAEQNGLFSFLPLKPQDAHLLREEKRLYFPTNGRMNISSLNASNFERCIEGFVSVLK